MKKYGILALLGIMIFAGCVTNISGIHVYDPVDYGAVPNGHTLCTTTIQKAIDECAAHGGGVVKLSGGRFLSGAIFMKSGVTLDLSEGSTLLGSTNLNHYPVTIPNFRSYTDNYTVRSLIYGENLTNIAITGKGTVYGQGEYFKGRHKVCPYGIRFITCQNVLIENVALSNSAMWMQHYLACDNVTIRGIKVWNHSKKSNLDGIDIDGCHNVLIKDCVIDSDDDGITLKSTSTRACENITIEDCIISSHCNAIKFGTESNGGLKNMKVSRCIIKPSADRKKIHGHPDGLAGIALEIVDGGIMDQVTISDIQIQGTISPIFIRLGNRARRFKKNMPQPGVGTLRNVTISDIKASGAGVMGCAIAGLKDHPIENLTLRNLSISFAGGGRKEDSIRRFDEKAKKYPECRMFADRLPAYGLYFWHVEGLRLDNVKLTTQKPDERAAIVMEDVSNVVINGKAVFNNQDIPQGIHFITDRGKNKK